MEICENVFLKNKNDKYSSFRNEYQKVPRFGGNEQFI